MDIILYGLALLTFVDFNDMGCFKIFYNRWLINIFTY